MPSADELRIPLAATAVRMTGESSHNNEIDAGVGDVIARLERYGAPQSGATDEVDTLAPVSPELVLVDPDLARRVRSQPSAPEPESRVEPPASTGPPARKRRRKRRLVVWIALVTILGLTAGFALTQVSSKRRHPVVDAERSGRSPANQSSSALDARPTTHEGRTPTRSTEQKGTPITPPAASAPRVFGWVAAPGVSFYLVRFFRNGQEIFRAQPTAPRLSLPPRWLFNGHRYTLTPGRYSWSVLPGFGRRAHPRYGQPIVQATLRIQV